MTLATATHPQVVSHLEQSRRITKAASGLAAALMPGLPIREREAEISYSVKKLSKAADPPTRPLASERFSDAGRGSSGQPPTIEDKLIIAAADATVAEVLFNASKAVGETSHRMNGEDLSRLVRLAESELSQLGPQTQGIQGFKESATPRFASTDMTEAGQTFKGQANAAVNKVLDESEAAVSKIFTSLAEKKDDLIKGFSEVGQLLGTGSNAFVLLGKAWEKLMSALTTLHKIVDSKPFQDALECLTDLKDSLNVRHFLSGVFQVDPLHAKIEGIQIHNSIGVKQVDMCSTEVADLQEHYTKVLRNMMTVTHIAAALLPFAAAHVAGPFAALAVPGVYSLSIVAIVFLGRDFTLSGVLYAGSGIQKIVTELLPAEVIPEDRG